ncbi:hypothetical protein HAX54_017515, partial [Datura stramonium]|nr:hypothetical protein [Datura stramonium]
QREYDECKEASEVESNKVRPQGPARHASLPALWVVRRTRGISALGGTTQQGLNAMASAGRQPLGAL